MADVYFIAGMTQAPGQLMPAAADFLDDAKWNDSFDEVEGEVNGNGCAPSLGDYVYSGYYLDEFDPVEYPGEYFSIPIVIPNGVYGDFAIVEGTLVEAAGLVILGGLYYWNAVLIDGWGDIASESGHEIEYMPIDYQWFVSGIPSGFYDDGVNGANGGYDVYGYDINGYDANGYDANGYDANGYNSNGITNVGLEFGLDQYFYLDGENLGDEPVGLADGWHEIVIDAYGTLGVDGLYVINGIFSSLPENGTGYWDGNSVWLGWAPELAGNYVAGVLQTSEGIDQLLAGFPNSTSIFGVALLAA